MLKNLLRWRESASGDEKHHPLVRLALALMLVAALALLVTPSRPRAQAELTAMDIDRVANSTLVATHDFTFEREDLDGIARARAEAAAGVVPVWDYNASLQDTVEERIGRAFVQARELIVAEGRQIDAEQREAATDRRQREVPARDGSGVDEAPDEQQGARDEDPEGDEPSPDDAVARAAEAVARVSDPEDGSGDVAEAVEPATGSPIEPLTDEEAAELVPLARRVQLVEALPAVGALVAAARDPDAIDLNAFAQDGFSREAHDALANLVRQAMSDHIVGDLATLEDVGVAGISLREIRDGRPTGERRLRRFLSIGHLGTIDELMAPARHHVDYINEQELRDAAWAAARALVLVNTQPNEAETRQRIDAASAAAEARFRETLTRRLRAGELLVERGAVIRAQDVALVDAMNASAPAQRSLLQLLLGSTVLVVLLVFPVLLFALGNLRRFSDDNKDLSMMCVVLLTHLGVTRVGIFVGDLVAAQGDIPTMAMYLLIPFAAGAMIVRILTNAENALVYALVYALLAGILFRFDMAYVTFALLASVVGNASVRAAQSRTDILRGAAMVGGLMLGIALAFVLLRDGGVGPAALYVTGAALLSGVTSALFVYAFLPLIEGTFRYTTPMRLMELANLNHPAMKELILKAPGSYHHSMMVGQLVEAACEAVNADALLGRVGSYFHDIGKMKNPQYFAENQQGINPHDKLKPNMSALVIKSHVKDGVELAKQYKLPPEIIDFIREHHGTSLILYFYRRAQEQTEAEVSELDYRYPGPKPQSRETAICMLADGIEAASRALPDPGHSHLKGLVQKMINKAFIDGQLEECDLTLKDLNSIAQAFLLRLTAFYHHRPEYPDVRKSQTTRRARRNDSGVRVAAEVADDDGTDGPEPPVADDSGGDEESASEQSGLNLRRLGM